MARKGTAPPAKSNRYALGVVVTPCAEAPLLQRVLIAAAERAGYAWRDDSNFHDPLDPALDGRVLMVCSDSSLLDDVSLAKSAVIVGAVETAGAAAAAQGGATLREGILYASHRLAVASEFIRKHPDAFIFSAQRMLADPEGELGGLIDSLKLPIKPVDRTRLFELVEDGAKLQSPHPHASQEAPSLKIFEERSLGIADSAWWSRELFWTVSQDWAPPGDVIDITGRARTLFFGPYFWLPPGRWRGLVRFSLSEDAARRRYMLDAAVDYHVFTQVQFWPVSAGDYEIPVDFLLEQCARVEIRIVLLTAALHGQLHFEGVRISRIEAPPVSEASAADGLYLSSR